MSHVASPWNECPRRPLPLDRWVCSIACNLSVTIMKQSTPSFLLIGLVLLHAGLIGAQQPAQPAPQPIEGEVVTLPVTAVVVPTTEPAPEPGAPAQAPPAQISQEVYTAIDDAVESARAAENAAAAALASAIAAQQALGPRPETTQEAPPAPPTEQPPVAAAAGEQPSPEQDTFAAPGFEEAVEEDDQLAGLQAPLEDQIAVSEEGGVPAQAIPPEIPERLATSLQGDQAFIGK